MECCLTLGMIGDYFTGALQESHICHICHIILGIDGDDISYYNTSGKALLEYRKINLDRDK